MRHGNPDRVTDDAAFAIAKTIPKTFAKVALKDLPRKAIDFTRQRLLHTYCRAETGSTASGGSEFGGRLPVATADFINGTISHACDFNHSHDELARHVSSKAVSAPLDHNPEINPMRKILAVFVSTLAVLAAPAALAQEVRFPSVMKIVVPFSPGAGTDLSARAVAAQLGPRLGTTVIVENRPGGSSLIGTQMVAKGPRDGSLLLLTTPSTVTAAATMRSVPFDLNNDLIPVSMLEEAPMMVVVSSKTDIKTPADLIAAARAKPDMLTYGTSGVGTLAHLAFELINDAAKIQMKHIPYKGGASSTTDVAAGTIDMTLGGSSAFAPQITAGRVRGIAVTSRQPSPSFPDLPTMDSVVPGVDLGIWYAVFAPAGISPAMAARLNRELNEIATTKEMRDLMVVTGGAPKALSLEDLRSRMRNEYGTWKKIATDKKILIE